jgi:TolA-binding protein
MRFVLFSVMAALTFIGCSKPSAEEMFNKGVDSQRAEQYDAAIGLYQELISTYPDSARTPEAYYALGAIYQNQKRSYHLAIDFYKQLVLKFPRHATSSNAAFIIGFIYNNELKQYDSARIAYEYFIKNYPDDHLVNDAKFELSNVGKTAEEIFAAQRQAALAEEKKVKRAKK